MVDNFVGILESVHERLAVILNGQVFGERSKVATAMAAPQSTFPLNLVLFEDPALSTKDISWTLRNPEPHTMFVRDAVQQLDARRRNVVENVELPPATLP